ncbi:heterokaryon incompatibility domain-containing protein [Trichoderma sp. SZMC 28014]
MQSHLLCSPCQSFISWTKTPNLPSDAYYVVPYKPSFEALEASAAQCPLCQYVFRDVLNKKPRYNGHEPTEVSYRIFAEVKTSSRRRLINVTWVEDLPFPSAGPRDPVYYLAHPESVGSRVMWQENTPSFESRLKAISVWLSYCDCHHTRCVERPSVMPRRLLDLKDVERSKVIRLVETSTAVGTDVRYATLSHCWGPRTSKPPLKTTSDNILHHFEGIPLDDLNLNFKDAVLISIKLGVQYIWIDSLCIIQDNSNDWEIEAEKMADIYRQSYINLAASAAHDAHGGMVDLSSLYISKAIPTAVIRYRSTDPTVQNTADQPDDELMIRPSSLKQEYRDLLSHKTSPYFARGWVLQEVALAPRTVYFTTDQIMWQCRELFESEDGTWSAENVIPALDYSFSVENCFDFTSKTRAYNLWQMWLKSYATRELTYSSDAAAAAAGLINYYKSATGHTPMLGLWKETLYADLKWAIRDRPFKGTEPSHSRPTSNFPSWSWLCMLPRGQSGAGFQNIIFSGKVIPSLRIEEYEEKWSGPAFTSKLEYAKLVISTFAQDGVLSFTKRGDATIEVNGSCVWQQYPTIEYELPQRSEYAVKLAHIEQTIYRHKDGKAYQYRDSFLVLRLAAGDPPRYERLGYGELDCFSLDDSVDRPGPTGHLERHFKESDRQSIELV